MYNCLFLSTSKCFNFLEFITIRIKIWEAYRQKNQKLNRLNSVLEIDGQEYSLAKEPLSETMRGILGEITINDCGVASDPIGEIYYSNKQYFPNLNALLELSDKESTEFQKYQQLLDKNRPETPKEIKKFEKSKQTKINSVMAAIRDFQIVDLTAWDSLVENLAMEFISSIYQEKKWVLDYILK